MPPMGSYWSPRAFATSWTAPAHVAGFRVELDHPRKVDRVRDAVGDAVAGPARVRHRMGDARGANSGRCDGEVRRDQHVAARLLIRRVPHRPLEARVDQPDRLEG